MPLLERYLNRYVEVFVMLVDNELNLATILIEDREYYITATRIMETQEHAYISLEDYILLSSNG